MRLSAAALALALLAPGSASGHAEIMERIAAVDAAIAAAPGDAGLYLKRGELHRLHGEPAPARGDFARAEAIAPGSWEVAFAIGRLDLETGDPAAAIRRLDRSLGANPDHPDALILRARAKAEVGNDAGAAADYDAAIGLLPAPVPELYLERAAVEGGLAALAGLDAGIDRLGPVVTLVGAAAEAAALAGRPDLALARLDLLPEALRDTPPWLSVRGDMLALTGARAEAAAVYDRALAAIAAMPEARRGLPKAAALKAELRAKRAAVGG